MYGTRVVLCKYKAVQGMLKCMFLIPCVKRMFFQNLCIRYGKKKTNVKRMMLHSCIFKNVHFIKYV